MPVPAEAFRILRPALRRIPSERRSFRARYRWFRDQAGYPMHKATIWALAEHAALDFDPASGSLTLMDWRG